MSGIANYIKKFASPYLLHLVGLILVLLTVACGDHSAAPASGNNTTADDSRAGSATFSVLWQTDNTVSTSAADAPTRSAIADCSAVGIESITCVVYDENDNPIANGGPWKCADHGGNMPVIPEGEDRTIAVLGWDTDLEVDGAQGNIIYQGTTNDPVTIVAGETTNAGEIVANPFVPTNLAATAVSINQIDLNWENAGAASYNIYQDGNEAASPTSPPFAIIDLEQNTEYCFTVSAVDGFGNESKQSIENCATTGSESDISPPTVPTSVIAVAVSQSQIDINWEQSDDNVGVSGYWVYGPDGQQLGPTPTPPLSHEGLQANTEYCYTVVAFDATGNPSDPSAESCATTTTSSDAEPPSRPEGLEVVAMTANQIDLSWTASTDNEGVSRYQIYRDNEPLGWATTPTYSDSTVQTDVEYCYTVEAYDAMNNISERSVAVCATPEAIITVNIDNQNEFTYIAQGNPMGLGADPTTAPALSAEPYEDLANEPDYGPYDSRYYGYLNMGNNQVDTMISFIIVTRNTISLPPTSWMYIDSNNNEDLTDDGDPYLNQGTTDLIFDVPLSAPVITDTGEEITRPYQLQMWVTNGRAQFFATCHYAGEIRIGSQRFTAVAFERFSHNALYRENGLFIDMNHDNQIDLESEFYQDQEKLSIGTQSYELRLSYP